MKFRHVIIFLLALITAMPAVAQRDAATTTPIKHVIVILAENRSFDHIFATYKPAAGESVLNLLSEGIIKEDGSPGPNFAKAAQSEAQVSDKYQLAPENKKPYATLPPLMTGSAPDKASDSKGPPFLTATMADAVDSGLLRGDQHLLLTGATGLPKRAIDTRLPNVKKLPNGPYQITPHIPYSAYTASPVHRFFQMWQQMDCTGKVATPDNTSGCLQDLYPWVEVSVGAGSNGKAQSPAFDNLATGEGSVAMGFYNMATGDAPYLKELADKYAMSDNFHQAVLGGTAANHIMLGSGDMIWYSDAKGEPATPPANQIENPNPQPDTNNYYTQDGYKGGSYVNCTDEKAPGVWPILAYLSSVAYAPKANCEPGHYYLVNNYNPGFFGDGSVNDKDPYTVPPSRLRTIGDALMERQVPFRYYGEGWNDYVRQPTGDENGYCNICNFLQYSVSIMSNHTLRAQHIADLDDFYHDIQVGTLPAVSFVKPSGLNDGHPASSRLDIFETFARRLIEAVQTDPQLWSNTAILITFDEAGGYWDSGFVQSIDFFGDGPRIPLIVVSPYAQGGRISHSYADHVSILKFIEKNWGLQPLTQRSRDNLPNPAAKPDDANPNPYVPANSPAIGDLMDLFRF